MPSTHLSLHYHLVFSTKDRRPLIVETWRDRLHAYLGGMVRTLGGVPLEVGGTEDHVHLLVRLRATHRLADVLRDIKGESSRWVHETVAAPLFSWQEGYGAFTVGPSETERIRRYIANQEAHHRGRSFEEEFLELLREHGVEYDERYLW
jgi:putative transposase